MPYARLQTAKSILKRFDASEPLIAPSDQYRINNAKLALNITDIDACLDGGLAINALHEVRCSYAKDVGVSFGFMVSLLCQLPNKTGKIIWVVDPAASLETGMLYPKGLEQFGIDPNRFTFIHARDLQNAMWATDEAAGCQGLAAVIFQVRGNPMRFNMTATRRLMLRAQQSNVFTCILRQSGEEEASAAATRWHVGAAPSLVDKDFKSGIGRLRHSLSLERNRNGQVGKWHIAWNHKIRKFENAAHPKTTNTLHSLSVSGNRSDHPRQGKSGKGQIINFSKS